MKKDKLLSALPDIKATIEALPDDVTICSITGFDGLLLQVMDHPALRVDSAEERDYGSKWCVMHGKVNVGFIRYPEATEDEPDF